MMIKRKNKMNSCSLKKISFSTKNKFMHFNELSFNNHQTKLKQNKSFK